MVNILDMTPIGHYYDKTPRYKFNNPLPRRPVVLDNKFSSVEEAYQDGVDWANKYQASKFPCGIAYCLGVTQINSENNSSPSYSAVVSYYYSNS